MRLCNPLLHLQLGYWISLVTLFFSFINLSVRRFDVETQEVDPGIVKWGSETG